MNGNTINGVLKKAAGILEAAGIDNSVYDAKCLLEHVLGCDRTYLFLHGNDVLEDERKAAYFSFIDKRAEHYPLQYITGSQGFMAYDFYVNEHVLIPRADTEILVEEALKVIDKDTKVLDMCCGSGCIGESIQLMTSAFVTLVDVSKEALAVAEKNAENLHAKVDLIQSDLFDNVSSHFHVIVSNPPYIRSDVIKTLMPEVRDFEPTLALDGTEDGLYFYREITKRAGEYLYETGYLFFEIGFDQGEDVKQILVEHGFEEIEIIKDLAGLDRVVKGRKQKHV